MSVGDKFEMNGGVRRGWLYLPNDLAQYVVEDKEAFQKKIVEFYV